VGGKGHGKGVDWWTLGILIFEMLASYTPFYHEDHMKMYQKITKGRINFPAHFSPVGYARYHYHHHHRQCNALVN
jgi:serine/threonine protein kinase